MITDQQLNQIMPHLSAANRNLYLPHLDSAMEEFDINNELRAAAFLGQLAHESGELRYMEEIASGSAYEGRHDLGNTQLGDGKRFKGRGPIQLTGRANYAKYGKLLGVDLISNPKLAATPEVAFRIAAQYWKLNKLNELADQRKYKEITKRINGGYNGLDDRIKYYDRALRVLPSNLGPDEDTGVPDFEPTGGADTSSSGIKEEKQPDEILDPKSTTENGEKGVTTSTKSADQVEGTPPPTPAVEVKASSPSWMSRISALSLPAGATAAIGGIYKFAVSIPPWGWAIMGGVILLAMSLGAWLYNESMKRAAQRTQTVLNAAADKDKNNLRLI